MNQNQVWGLGVSKTGSKPEILELESGLNSYN